MAKTKKKLDTIVKLGLGVFFGFCIMIAVGTFLTRPDRSIPPYSIGSQVGTAVAVHVPTRTRDPEIESLIYRFRKVGRETREFGLMKIWPTTPGDPEGRYRDITIYIFGRDSWAEPESLRRYVAALASETGEDQSFREAFEQAVRGFYRVEDDEEEGRIGPLIGKEEIPGTAASVRVLFKGPLTAVPLDAPDGTARSPSPLPASSRY